MTIANTDEWSKHIDKILEKHGISRGEEIEINDEEIWREIFTFDFKFNSVPLDTITDESQSSMESAELESKEFYEKYWWLPLVISNISLIISIIRLIILK